METREKAWFYHSARPCLPCVMWLMAVFYVHSVIDQSQTGTSGVVRHCRRHGPSIMYKNLMGVFCQFLSTLFNTVVCRPQIPLCRGDAGIEPRTLASLDLAVRRSNHPARSRLRKIAKATLMTSFGEMVFRDKKKIDRSSDSLRLYNVPICWLCRNVNTVCTVKKKMWRIILLFSR